MKHFVFILGFLALVLAACTALDGTTPTPGTGETPGPATPTAIAGTPGGGNPLANSQWTLVSMGPAGAEEPVGPGTTVTLEFGQGGEAGGSGGCNGYGTTYEVSESTISFGEITSTLIACEAPGVMDQESRFFQALQAAGAFELTGDTLQIEYSGGESVLNFARSSPQGTGTPAPGSGLLCSETQAVTDTGWQVCQSNDYGFQVHYPPDAAIVDQTEQSARIDLLFTQGTNLNEKYLQITVEEAAETCSSPLAEGHEPGSIPTETVQINDLEFTKETAQEGAAGSLYEWVAYSLWRDGLCVSLGFVLRSSNPDAFATPPALFDKEAESAVFEEIVATFQWLEPGP